ncbi:polysaccharide lyase family 1 protein [Rheinheimera sp.]|uniref:pectate lyase family protein n=1 Tax=Rheinheimera sp. TaxID=1869214 RepID=UPI002734A543|nr:hypothetical protein [Rheinheimera sp.]MDP2716261.1 hypothetical protein [Rheinheimera sp.]
MVLPLLAGTVAAQSDKHCTNFGLDTPGGAGGVVLKVTNLNRNGPGSLAAALAHSGPRIVVFEVAGVIDLQRTNLEINQPYLTIAGETAPNPGITLIKGGLRIISHDVIVRHLHIRPGDAGLAKRAGWDTDGIAVTGSNACNVLVEHNSISWATDELVSASGPRDKGAAATSKHISFRHNILAEALDYASHIKGKHSKGALVHDNVQQVAFIGNLFVSNDRRNPYFKAFSSGVVANNLIINAGNAAVQLGFIEREWQSSGISPQNPQVAVVGNVLRYGTDSYSDLALISDRGDAFMADNQTFNLRQQAMYDTQGVINRLDTPPLWPAGYSALPASETEAMVLTQAGARYWQRDSIDQRIVQQVQTGNSRIIDSQQQVGGYPQIEPVYRALDVPTDNIKAWLDSFIPAGNKQQEP